MPINKPNCCDGSSNTVHDHFPDETSRDNHLTNYHSVSSSLSTSLNHLTSYKGSVSTTWLWLRRLALRGRWVSSFLTSCRQELRSCPPRVLWAEQGANSWCQLLVFFAFEQLESMVFWHHDSEWIHCAAKVNWKDQVLPFRRLLITDTKILGTWGFPLTHKSIMANNDGHHVDICLASVVPCDS